MRWGAVLALATIAVAWPSMAHASCAQDPEQFLFHSDHPIVFVGTVTAVRGGYAQLRVERVAKGPDLAPTVWVQGGQDQPPFPRSLFESVASSGDVAWTLGARYAIGAWGNIRTSDCSVFSAAAVDLFREAANRPPVAGGLTGVQLPPDPLPAVLVTCGVVLAALALIIVWATRRSRRVA